MYNFFDWLERFLNNINYLTQPLIIMGDININLLNRNDTYTSKFMKFLKMYHLHNINPSQPTRITMTSKTNIDVILCNTVSKPFLNNLMINHNGISDHAMLSIYFKKPINLKRSVRPP